MKLFVTACNFFGYKKITTQYLDKKNGHYDYAKNQNTVLITQYQHDQEIGTVARLAATSRIAAHQSAIKLDFRYPMIGTVF